jgi:hypothetical protein
LRYQPHGVGRLHTYSMALERSTTDGFGTWAISPPVPSGEGKFYPPFGLTAATPSRWLATPLVCGTAALTDDWYPSAARHDASEPGHGV